VIGYSILSFNMIYNTSCCVYVSFASHKESVNSVTYLFLNVIRQCSEHILVCGHHILMSHSGLFQSYLTVL
jgi:hypothetical protein